MDMLEKARELGEAIKASDEMAALKATEEAQNNDAEAQALLQEFNLKRMNLARDMHEGKLTQEEAIEKNNEEFAKVAENKLIAEYLDAKKAFDAAVNEINGILNYYITGQEPGCTHDCGSCGGCH